MLPNLPILRYNRHHHWLWILRRLRSSGKLLFMITLFFLSLLGLFFTETDPGLLLLLAGVLAVLITAELSMLGFILLDWRTRIIKLYSDGRLEYEFGIWSRDGKSVSMRFGAVRYRYHDRVGTLLDCADLVLPFDAGVIADVADFREFWDIAQGRQ